MDFFSFDGWYNDLLVNYFKFLPQYSFSMVRDIYISDQKLKDFGWTIQIPFDQGLQPLIDECYKAYLT
jgi:hypothetical protein